MHASEVLQRCIGKSLDALHGHRRRGLLGCVDALSAGQHLTLIDLARSWPGAERVAAPLKRIDRLLSNPRLLAECDGVYGAMTRWLLRPGVEPVIIVDWSELDRMRRHAVLRAALAVGGRTLTLLEIVVPMKQMNTPAVETRLLNALAVLMPAGVRPILIADAGFRLPWLRKVTALGWHFVGRIRSGMLARPAAAPARTDQWVSCRDLYDLATTRTRDLGAYVVGRRDLFALRLIVHKKAAQGRMHMTLRGERVRETKSRLIAARESEPWLLAVSEGLDRTPAQLAALYARRMQIEQSFRDLKSHRFGVGFEDSLTRKANRLSILLLILALAAFAAWISARYADPIVRQCAAEALSRPCRRVTVSWHRIGLWLLKHARFKLPPIHPHALGAG